MQSRMFWTINSCLSVFDFCVVEENVEYEHLSKLVQVTMS